MRLLLSAFVAVLGFALTGCGGNGDEAQDGDASGGGRPTLYFSAIPDRGSTELKQKFDEVAEALSEKLGVPVEYKPAIDYGATVQMFKNGDVHLGWFGGLTGCQARASVPGARAIAQGAADPQFKSYFIAHKDTGLTKSDDFPLGLKGLTFTFGSERSTSGRLMPEFYIREETGMAPREFFKTVAFSGAHDRTAEAVANGSVQAGAINFKTYDGMVEKGTIDPDACRVVWVTPDYADYNWTVHPALEKMYGEGFIDKVQDALCDLPTELLAAMDRDELIPAKNEEFQGIADVAKSLDLLR